MPLDWIRNLFRAKKRAKICLLGPSGAGKTTMLWYMKTGNPVKDGTAVMESGKQVQIKPTHGVDVETFEFKAEGGESWTFAVCDLGGQPVYREVFWEIGVRQATDAIVFMIDATDREHIKENKEIFEYMVKLLHDETPVLLMANKQDLKEKNPMSEKEVLEQYEVAKTLSNHSVHVAECSAVCGDGLKDAFTYLVEKIKNR